LAVRPERAIYKDKPHQYKQKQCRSGNNGLFNPVHAGFGRDFNMPSRSGKRTPAILFLITCGLAQTQLLAGDANAPATVAGYQAVVAPANIAPTPGTADDPAQKVEVVGEPRMSEGHPCTLWDKQDLTELRQQLKTDKVLQAAFIALKSATDKRITQPLNVPVPQKGPDGNWMYPGDFLPGDGSPNQKIGRNSGANASSIADLGTMYSLTGEEKYGEFCKQMLLAYAQSYAHYGHPPFKGEPWTLRAYRSAFDGRLTGQFLDDGFWLIKVAWGYDQIFHLPSWTAEERKQVREDLFEAVSAQFVAEIIGPASYLGTRDNRSALCASGVLLAGYACEDEKLINYALYGKGGTKDKPTGGVFGTHFTPACILPDGLWVEGAPAYQLQIAGAALFNDAEILWRHGVDMYRYRNGVLKRLLDSGLLLANPDPSMTVPCLHDSGRFSLLDSRDWLNGEIGTAYESGYRRYRDPRYVPLLKNATKHLSLTIHSGPPSTLTTWPAEAETVRVPMQNVNFYATGYGILRVSEAERTNSLLLEFGPSAGHAHPSKLGIDLYAFGDTLLPFPGVIFPYNDPLDVKWYWTTLSNCALEVDEKPQIYSGNRYKFPRTLPDPVALQLVYGPGTTLGIQRAYSDTVNPGVTLDRSLFLTSGYLADLFGAFSAAPHQYDLAWHFRGELSTELPLAAMKFPEPVADGYNALDNVRHAATDQAWSATIRFHDKPVRFLTAAGAGTDVIIGDGYFEGRKERPPTVLSRRVNQKNALYSQALDLSGDKEAYVKGIVQTGGLEAGYGLLNIQTAQGTDLCFAAFRPGTYTAGDLTTDAQQAMVLRDGTSVRAMYLGGGKLLKVGDAVLERSESGLACVEKLADGTVSVANPSPTKTKITVTLPALGGSKTVDLEAGARWISPAGATK
jgi:hypothetical protein